MSAHTSIGLELSKLIRIAIAAGSSVVEDRQVQLAETSRGSDQVDLNGLPFPDPEYVRHRQSLLRKRHDSRISLHERPFDHDLRSAPKSPARVTSLKGLADQSLIRERSTKNLLDRKDVTLPQATGRSFWLNGSAWEYPDFENAETFVNRLVHDGLIAIDVAVDAALQDYRQRLSLRSIQRHFLQTTGLTQGAIRQIERARHGCAKSRLAVYLLYLRRGQSAQKQ